TISDEESDIKRSFISANDEIPTTQITLQNYQSSIYTSRLIKTKEIKLAYESAKFRAIEMNQSIILWEFFRILKYVDKIYLQ
ncbi:15346_t:CDS:2, partial [Gigaspora margarita]